MSKIPKILDALSSRVSLFTWNFYGHIDRPGDFHVVTCCHDHETSGDVTGSFLECILSRMLYIRTRSVSFQLNPPEVTLTEDATPIQFQRQTYKYIF